MPWRVKFTVVPPVYFCMFIHVWELGSNTAAALWIDKQELAFICHRRIHFLQEGRPERSYFWHQVCKVHWTFFFAVQTLWPITGKALWHRAAISQRNGCEHTCARRSMNYCCVSSPARISICAVGFNNEPIVWVRSGGVSSPPPAHSPQAPLESANLQFNSPSEPNRGAERAVAFGFSREQTYWYFYIKMTHGISSCSEWLFVRLIWWLACFFSFQFVEQSSWFSPRFVSVHVDKRSDVSSISIYLVDRSEEDFFFCLQE